MCYSHIYERNDNEENFDDETEWLFELKTQNYAERIVVVGSGPISAVIIKTIISKNTKCTVVPGHFKATQLLNITVNGKTTPTHVYENQEGGNSSKWGGRVCFFNNLDFEDRDYLGLKAWPIKSTEISKYLKQAAEFLGVNGYEDEDVKFNSVFNKKREYWSANKNIWDDIIKSQRKNQDLFIHEDFKIVDLIFFNDTSKIKGILIMNSVGEFKEIFAQKVILALGTVGNCEFMLKMARKYPELFVNIAPNIGSNVMLHTIVKLDFLHPLQDFDSEFMVTRKEISKIIFQLNSEVQEKYRVGNALIGFSHQDTNYLNMLDVGNKIVRLLKRHKFSVIKHIINNKNLIKLEMNRFLVEKFQLLEFGFKSFKNKNRVQGGGGGFSEFIYK
jgi:hypothetical protein